MSESATKKGSNVTPVTIRAYTNKTLTGNPVKEFNLPINPENYAMTYKTEVDKTSGRANSGSNTQYLRSPPEQLKLEFIFDNTGTVMGNILDGTSVQQQVKLFMEMAYLVNGEKHKPNYLKIIWGENLMTGDDVGFNCMLTQLDINYTLFARTGEPIRAKLAAQFTHYIEQTARVNRREDHRSPDLTHVRTVKLGDRLSLMTHNIYDDQSYYMKVAKANSFTSFRKLKVGDDINFPPIKEVE